MIRTVAGCLLLVLALAWTAGCNVIPINIPDPKAQSDGGPPLGGDGGINGGLDTSAADLWWNQHADIAGPPSPDAAAGGDGAPLPIADGGQVSDGVLGDGLVGDGLVPGEAGPAGDGLTEAGPTGDGPVEAGTTQDGLMPLDAGVAPDAGGPDA